MNPVVANALPHRSPRSRIAGIGATAVLVMVLLTGLGPALDGVGLPGVPPVDAATGPHLIASAADIAALPTSGGAWQNMKAAADSSAGTPNLSNQDSNTDVMILAKAFVYARTKVLTYRNQVMSALKAVIGTEAGGRTLAAGRGIPAYVIAADLINLPSYDPTFNTGTFRPWLKKLLTENLQGDTLVGTQETRPNNWGTHAGAARAAIAIYLGDSAQLARTARVFKGFLGDRASYAGFNYGDLSWQCDPAKPVGIDVACVKSGIALDGAIPDEMRRGGPLKWPPATTLYPWELMQGAVVEAELLQRAGYPAWSWQNRALLRAAKFLYNRAGWPATSNDDWQPWLLDFRYGTSFRTTGKTHVGKNFAWTDWLYGKRVKSSPASATGWHSYGDSSSLVRYRGSWSRSFSKRHIGGWVHLSRRTGSKAIFKFSGDSVVWIGPKGPSQGRAGVFIDGKLMKTVNLHSAIRHYRVTLYTAKFSAVKTHYLTIKVLGTPGHPVVAVDGYRVHR
jgi:Alginate lyase